MSSNSICSALLLRRLYEAHSKPQLDDFLHCYFAKLQFFYYKFIIAGTQEYRSTHPTSSLVSLTSHTQSDNARKVSRLFKLLHGRTRRGLLKHLPYVSSKRHFGVRVNPRITSLSPLVTGGKVFTTSTR